MGYGFVRGTIGCFCRPGRSRLPPANRRAFPAPEPGARSWSGQFTLGKSRPESHSGKYWSLYVNIETLTEGKLSASSKRSTDAATMKAPAVSLMTEAQGFELSKSRTGFPWHHDSLSFRYIRPQDSAYSIWIPLDKVDVERGGGGMAYVPENILSAKANFSFPACRPRKWRAGSHLTRWPPRWAKFSARRACLRVSWRNTRRRTTLNRATPFSLPSRLGTDLAH